MNEWEESAAEEQAIVNLQGVPKTDVEGSITRRELISFSAVCKLVGRKLSDAGALTEEYVRAKVAQESNAAKKSAEEAAELASRREENEAKADLIRQQATGTFLDNLKAIAELPPMEQALALAKIMESNPKIAQQLERIELLVTQLSLKDGVKIEEKKERENLPDDTISRSASNK